MLDCESLHYPLIDRPLKPLHSTPRPHPSPPEPIRAPLFRPRKVIEPLESIPDKRQTKLSLILLPKPLNLRAMSGRVVVLVDLVDGEVGSVDVGFQVGLEGRADLA